ncbi:MAG: hypothetical protein KHY44_14915 [Clostridiales bacterium]|jgi:hypothetical protein|nr:hypothetical protein [Clostridiales bacterium]
MALWDIIEAIFRGGQKATNKFMDIAYEQRDRMESEVSKCEARASRLSDDELKEAFKNADGTSKVAYGRELKDRGYGR